MTEQMRFISWFGTSLVLSLGIFGISTLFSEGTTPFVWADIGIVYWLCSCPLALLITQFLLFRLPVWGLVPSGLALIFLTLESIWQASFSTGDPASTWRMRFLVALGMSVGSLLCCGGGWKWVHQLPSFPKVTGWSWLLAGMIGLVVPEVYLLSRCQREGDRLVESIQQNRLGDSLRLAEQLNVLHPDQELQGQKVAVITQRLQARYKEYRKLAERPLLENPSEGELRERAELLAVLGKRDQARELLLPLPDPSPETLTFLGLLAEQDQEWKHGVNCYAQAVSAWEKKAPSFERSQGLQKAWKGIGYCQRKLGNTPEAEEAYQAALQQLPTAEMHFLAAQFYEDAQQTAKAAKHARKAKSLSLSYEKLADELLNRLQSSHFGCFSVWSADD